MAGPFFIMKRKLLNLSIILLASVTAVAGLFIASKKSTLSSGSFSRKMPPHQIMPQRFIDIAFNSYYIAGATTEHIYFGNKAAPGHLLRATHDLRDTVHITIEFPVDSVLRQSVRLAVDSPYLYAFAGRSANILLAKLNDSVFKFLPHNNKIYFTDGIALTKNKFLFKTYDLQEHKTVLTTEEIAAQRISFYPSLLEQQGDGVFSTDGMTVFSPQAKAIAYIYYYRNKFTILDTAMKIRIQSKTIDSIHTAKISLDKIASKNAVTFSKPPTTVNKASCMDSSRLYIYSSVLAANQSKNEFDIAATIDVYKLTSGQYEFSFYIPDFRGVRVTDFRIFGKSLYVLHGRFAYSYQLRF